MKTITSVIIGGFLLSAACGSFAAADVGPDAVLDYEMSFRGELCVPPDAIHLFPNATPIAFAGTKHIRVMTQDLWRPAAIVADFARRSAAMPVAQRPKGIIVVLKTERCATKEARLCSTTTAALEKRSTPLVEQFEIYGLELKPRDGDDPPGSKPIETGADAWKNEAAGEYRFAQGSGATIVVLDPATGREVAHSNALQLKLWEKELIANHGRTPELEQFLAHALRKLSATQSTREMTAVAGVR